MAMPRAANTRYHTMPNNILEFNTGGEPHIPMAKPHLGGKEFEYVNECLTTGWISSQGKFVKEFEKRMADYIGVQYGVATSNGTTALHLVLHSLGIGPGDEVIVPTLTFIATANAVHYTGAKPIFVDSEKDTWNIDPALVEQAITARTKAIIPVHLYGQPCKMDEIMDIAKRHNLYVIEDAAEAHGAEYKGRKAGSIGDVACFSFFGNKIITTGEGGMILTNDQNLCEKMMILRDHGMSKEKRYWHPQVGFNYRLTNIQAAIGCAQLERIDRILKEKRCIKDTYNRHFESYSKIILPPDNVWSKNVYWMYTVLLNENKTIPRRDYLIDALKKCNIESRPIFYPIHTMPPYYSRASYPVAEMISRNGISLPSYVGLREEDIARICDAVKNSI